MSRSAFLLSLLLPFFVAPAPTPAAAADADGSYLSNLPALRLHRRAVPDEAGAVRYTPFILTPYQAKIIDAYEYGHFLSAQCLCEKAKERPSDAPSATKEEEDDQRQECAATVRLELSSRLFEAPSRLLAPIEQQAQPDRPPSAESFSLRSSTPELAPGGLRRSAMTKRLRAAAAESLEAVSDALAGAWRYLTHDVRLELQRQAADVSPWRGSSNIGGGGGRAVLPMQHLVPIGGR